MNKIIFELETLLYFLYNNNITDEDINKNMENIREVCARLYEKKNIINEEYLKAKHYNLDVELQSMVNIENIKIFKIELNYLSVCTSLVTFELILKYLNDLKECYTDVSYIQNKFEVCYNMYFELIVGINALKNNLHEENIERNLKDSVKAINLLDKTNDAIMGNRYIRR